jgi:YHS domain-containing protein
MLTGNGKRRMGEEGMSIVWDVVCGMQGNDQHWTSTAEYSGRVYYFCCDGCKGAFAKSPEYHLENFREEHPDLNPGRLKDQARTGNE